MKLSADMIYEHLSSQIKLERFGPKDNELTLKFVLFYEEGMAIESGHIYLVRHGILSGISDAQLKGKGHLIICADGKIPPAWVRNRYSFFVTEPLENGCLLNMIQGIFSRYYNWEETLHHILQDDGDIKKMVLCSADIFENPITITNTSLEILGASGYSEESGSWYLYDYKSIPLEYLERFHSLYNQHTQRKKPYLHDDNGHELVYSINLFIHEKYRGCASVSELCRPFRPSDYTLFQYFTQYVNEAIRRQLSHSRSSFVFIKSTLQSLLNRVHIDESQLISALNDIAFISHDPQFSWVCIVIRSHHQADFIVPEYMISSLEERLPECIALPYEEDILLLMQLSSDKGPLQAALDRIVPVLKKVGFFLGISDRFEQICDIRMAYQKACCAIETGVALGINAKAYHFSDYVLSYMLSNAKGEFQLRDILPQGFSALLQHDQTSDVCYEETLRCYLENQMNIAKTARELYLHRSSLVQRLERIFRILGTQLQDPEERLFYSILLRLLKPGT